MSEITFALACYAAIVSTIGAAYTIRKRYDIQINLVNHGDAQFMQQGQTSIH